MYVITELGKLRQLQQGEYITKLIDKCKSTKITRHPISCRMTLLIEGSEMDIFPCNYGP